MMNIVKTAIITIVISIISGLLLEYFKNLAPRILCNIGNCVPMRKDNKRVYAYVITIRNLSKKIIHELTLNVQGSKSSLNIENAKITKGLKFDSLIKDNILDINIPFLSKGDKFTVTVYVENRNKPVIVMRSPENFKRIDSLEEMGVLSSLFNTSKNINEEIPSKNKRSEAVSSNKNDDFTMVMDKPLGNEKSIGRANRDVIHRNKGLSKNKKTMIAIASVILFIIVGVLVKFCLKGTSPATNTQTSSVKTDNTKQSNDAAQSTKGTGKNSDVNSSANKANKNTDTKSQTSGTNGNIDTKSQTTGTTGNSSTNTKTSGSTGNTDSNGQTSGTTGNTDTKSQQNGTTGNTDSKGQVSGTSGNTDTKSQTGATTGSGSAGANTNSGGTNESTGK